MPKRIPMRQCLGCREMKPKPELLRVVRSPEARSRSMRGARNRDEARTSARTPSVFAAR